MEMSLEALLHDEEFRANSNWQTLLGFAQQIARGMVQLEEKGIFHCDLRTANVLIKAGNPIVCKVNFGLSQNTYNPSRINSPQLPTKWTDIQVLEGRPMTAKSDVFSFAVLCFELFTYGEMPYQGMSNQDVAQFVANGNRLTLPESTLDAVKQCIERL
eukprot:TRINITY_DN12553_c0_g1_i1.p1 TRINITY_DN12553_c0_g1~~TRINITY_DN12553_c0_g1_i1.p1  ORF type:complete len:158 (+),score=25.62 TRINITY_DN12553_c0_g1_i1:230-703(+)